MLRKNNRFVSLSLPTGQAGLSKAVEGGLIQDFYLLMSQ